MGLILCIETATTNCSVSLGHNGKLLALKEDNATSYSHAERLHLYIQELLKENKCSPKDLDAIAVSKGPGSYTGLRIGVSSAKGLCFSLGIPLISVSTLFSLALKVKKENVAFIVPMLDARRMEVYTAGFTSTMEPAFETTAKILEPNSFKAYLEKGKVVFIGNGVQKFQDICSHPNALFIPDELPSAREMLSLANRKYREKTFEDTAYFEPFYLKDFLPG